MNSYPLISILIPVYNVEQYISRCICSVMAQTYTGRMECIIVDDYGTDGSISRAEQLMKDYKGSIEFLILRHTHNRGLAAARNTAVAASNGEFVIHVDSDDWIEANMVEDLVRRQIETNADIVSCNAVAHYNNHEELMIEPDYESKDAMMRNVLQLTMDHVIWRRLIRSSLYKDNKISAVEGINIGEDHYTLPRLLFYTNKFAKCDGVLYHYNCLNENSYMQSTRGTINYTRFKSDIASINVLLEFFQQHQSIYVEELYKVKVQYVYHNLWRVLEIGNKELYVKLFPYWDEIDEKYKKIINISPIRKKLLSPQYYIYNRLRVRCKRLAQKIVKPIRKIYGKAFNNCSSGI